MESEPAADNDPTRRALLAALAGGLALAAPTAGEGKQGKKKPKPKPPLAAAVARVINSSFTPDESLILLEYEYLARDLRPGSGATLRDTALAATSGGTVEQMRAEIIADVRVIVGPDLGVAPERVAVLLV